MIFRARIRGLERWGQFLLSRTRNDFFATFGVRLTSGELRDEFVRAGFTAPSGFVCQESAGYIRLATTDEDRQLQAVGEGDMKITPLEMLAAYRYLAIRRTATDLSDAERTVFAGLDEDLVALWEAYEQRGAERAV